MRSRHWMVFSVLWFLVVAYLILFRGAFQPEDHGATSSTTITRVTAITEMGDPGFKVTLSDGQVMYVMACPDEGAPDKLRLTCYDGKRGELRLADGTTYGK